jgi:hypothetical protein
MPETHPEKRLIGYARVSTYGQTLDIQLEQLRKAGCGSRNIYREKVTGARADRRELNRMLGKLGPGDVVTVTRIDRLARSTFDLFGIVKRIVDAKAQFRSLAEPWADSSSSTGRLMLAVLGGLADVERDLIRTRTATKGLSLSCCESVSYWLTGSAVNVFVFGQKKNLMDIHMMMIFPNIDKNPVSLRDTLEGRSEPRSTTSRYLHEY